MKNIGFYFMLCSICILSCSKCGKQESELGKLFREYHEEYLALSPIEATQQGDHRYNHVIPNDGSDEYVKELLGFYNKYLEKLNEMDLSKLNEEELLNVKILKYDISVRIEQLQLEPLRYFPLSQFWGLHLLVAQLGSGQSFQPFKTVKDYENWLSRMNDFKTWSETAIGNFVEGLKNGYSLPKPLVEKIIGQMGNMILVTDVEEYLFYGPIKNLPNDFSDEDKERLTQEYIHAIRTVISPTFEKLHSFFSDYYIEQAGSHSGISSLPQGEEIYNHFIKYWTTTDFTADEIFEMGLSEVSRIKSEMEKIKDELAFKGTLQDFFKHLKSDPQFTPYNSAEEIIKAFEDIQQKIEPQLDTYFTVFPKSGFEIRQTEAFRAATASAEYQPGDPDGSRPGIFYIPILDPKKFNITSGMESLFLHEAIPGHHYQISLQQENEDLPKFRRFNWYGAYGEGWALYCETLGKELGLYQDPYQYFGALGDEMHRAIRLVVDVGLHVKGWTREEAIEYMMDNESVSEQYAISEIERYMAIPGQALSYKIGQMKINSLREKYTHELEEHFNIAAFHDQILKYGNVPLGILEELMDEWSASQLP